MKVLQISSDFAKQALYSLLVSKLSMKGLKQSVYVPVRTKQEIDRNRDNSLQNVDYVYSYILRIQDRINYFGKIKKTTKDLEKNIVLDHINLTHAHFLFSDGGIALSLKQKFGIPYIVAVRNTDVNIFFKYMLHVRSHGINILKNASKIIFLSHKYKEYVLNRYVPVSLHAEILSKTVVVPNGIDDFWLSNINTRTTALASPIKLLYVGNFTKNKNIHIVMSAVLLLIREGIKVTFTIVGGGGDYENRIKKLAKKFPHIFYLIERIQDKHKLQKIYRGHDIFVMPSKHETFGLVYLEAISQGLPVIYSNGQGIDGLFSDIEVGYSVKSRDICDLCLKIKTMIKEYPSFANKGFALSDRFSWDKICNQYLQIYHDV